MGKPGDELGLLLVGDEPEGDDEGEGGDSAKVLAARALMKAIRRDDESAVADAFQQMMDCCDDEYDDEDEPAEDDE